MLSATSTTTAKSDPERANSEEVAQLTEMMEFSSKESMQRKRKRALEACREPRLPKTHRDHVLEEMLWLSKDFESERKWKLAQAKKVALRPARGCWIRLPGKKRTSRYSTMLAENLVDKPLQKYSVLDQQNIPHEERQQNDTKEPGSAEPQSDTGYDDGDYDVQSDESEDDEHTIEEDEALITAEERQEEWAALRNEIDIPIEELLKRYALEKGKGKDYFAISDTEMSSLPFNAGQRCVSCEVNGALVMPENHLLEIETGETRNQSNVTDNLTKDHILYDFDEEQEDGEFVLANGEEKDDETTLSEEEDLQKLIQTIPQMRFYCCKRRVKFLWKNCLQAIKRPIRSSTMMKF
ncbi:hypothetical protein GH714_013743 [Hevea brasiliensis]|uniref:HSA domain-containing protein n=1 Tax=Hevea brasiliensis TaxID=3981 RepID=A0A6A6KBL2_HEVBR|nr:hypothetical protein GH714_013743 [Hevea brasiliensis]